MVTSTAPRPARLAELLGALSLASDLGMGQPMEHALRQTLIALRLGERIGLDGGARRAVYYTGLMAWIGCHVDAYEQAKWFGDDMALKSDFRKTDFANNRAEMAFMMRHLGAGRSVVGRARTGAGFVGGGMKDAESMLAIHWQAADQLAEGLGFDDEIRKSIEQTFERWDGRGSPNGARGDDIRLTSRLVNLADVVEVFHRAGGLTAAVEVARARAGTQFDPQLVDAFCDCASQLCSDLDDTTSWAAIIDAEPMLEQPLAEEEYERSLQAIADFTDVKQPYAIGHSRRVAELADAAGRTAGLSPGDVTVLRRAALVHDIGCLGVPNSIWDKGAELNIAETERVRLHPYLTQRTLAASSALAPLGDVAVLHHERLDGSGYPGRLRGDAVSVSGRLLAAADVYCAKREPRPYREAMTPGDVATFLRGEVRAGLLDGEAVEVVLRASGHRVRQRRDAVAGLTTRELEVLRLLAVGKSTKQIAHELRISRKTAGNHVEHIYTKIGVSNRALASLFAAKHGLIGGYDDAS